MMERLCATARANSVRIHRFHWMTGESGRRAGPEPLMLALSGVYLVILLVVVLINLL